jgi:hypothetical protein
MRLWLAGMIPRPNLSRTQRGVCYRAWRALDYEEGHAWEAVAGVFPHILPNLVQLSINMSTRFEDRKHYWAGQSHWFPPCLVVRFPKLSSVKTSFVPTWVVLKTHSSYPTHRLLRR